MTTEEKAKAYDEALEMAKNVLQTDLHESGVWAIKKIFPELTESEDERIRKAIVTLIEDLQHYSTNYAGVEPKDMLAYLEKQKEQKPRWKINNPYTTKWTKEIIDEKFEKLVEEFNPEWSEEDENNTGWLIAYLEGKIVYHSDNLHKSIIKWLRSIRDRLKKRY